MNLPIYQHINLTSASLDYLSGILNRDLNMKHPVALNLRNLSLDEQREVIGLIENYFTSNNLSYKFPYPIYLISEHETSISRLPVLNDPKELPKFYVQKESRMNVKEAHLAGKNKLLQQEIRNTDTSSNSQALINYGEAHRLIYEQEIERKTYRSILTKLLKASNG